jgi:type I restriction enzyme M protein
MNKINLKVGNRKIRYFCCGARRTYPLNFDQSFPINAVPSARVDFTPINLRGLGMLTGEIRSQVDAIWNAFWTGGISNPLEVIEQITYLLFLRRLDELQEVEELKATRLKRPIERRVFPRGKDAKGMAYDDYRWSRFKNGEARAMFETVSEHVFLWLRSLGVDGSTYAHHMKDARFTIPTPQLLAKVVDLIDKVPMEDRDTKGDLYEYMLGKIATAGQNGQFRTPRHIIKLMVELVEPKPKDVICDPACGTAGFLIAAGEYLRQHHPEILRDDKLRAHFHDKMFHGFDFDSTMLRIGSMNMLLHGIENPAIVYRDSLAQDHAGETEKYTLVLANPPFAGSLDYESTAKDLLEVVKTKKTELSIPRIVPAPAKAGRTRSSNCSRWGIVWFNQGTQRFPSNAR